MTKKLIKGLESGQTNKILMDHRIAALPEFEQCGHLIESTCNCEPLTGSLRKIMCTNGHPYNNGLPYDREQP